MRTDDLVDLLATGAGAVEPEGIRHRYATALGWGALGATLCMAIGLGVRPDLAAAATTPMFWVKLAYPVVVAGSALMMALRLGRPGAGVGRAPYAVVAPVLAMWLLAFVALASAPAPEREQLVFGETWAECPIYIAVLSVPLLIAALWATRGLAPTRPAVAGAVTGLLAGAMAAAVYALHCPEMAAPFLGIWYLAGMLIPAAAGALLGLRLLRW
jgi:hypothetical protein